MNTALLDVTHELRLLEKFEISTYVLTFSSFKQQWGCNKTNIGSIENATLLLFEET